MYGCDYVPVLHFVLFGINVWTEYRLQYLSKDVQCATCLIQAGLLLQVPPELHRELFLKAKQKAEVSPDFFKSMLGEGTDLKGAALSFFKKMTG